MLTVYGIKSCDTCRRARKYFAEHDIEFRFHDVRDDGLDIQMLERWSDRIEWQKLLNRQSLTWRKIPEVDRADLGKEKAHPLCKGCHQEKGSGPTKCSGCKPC